MALFSRGFSHCEAFLQTECVSFQLRGEKYFYAPSYQKMKTSPAKYMDVSALQSRWDLHPESVRRIIRSGHLPAIRFGGRLRIDLEDVMSFEKSHRVNVGTDTR